MSRGQAKAFDGQEASHVFKVALGVGMLQWRRNCSKSRSGLYRHRELLSLKHRRSATPSRLRSAQEALAMHFLSERCSAGV